MKPIQPIDIDAILPQLTLDQKASLVAGSDFWHSMPIESLGVSAIRFSDGPNGVRGTKFFYGTPSYCVPCGTALGATFDTELLWKIGNLLGREARDKGVHVLLGPTMNIQRSPLGGRGFESFSEDSVLSGELGAAYCLGVKEAGVIPTPKHFVCNDQEHQRIAVNSIVTQRALREIYLRPFQIALAKARPAALMTAYNKVNGIHAAEDPHLLLNILRGEWGWEGLIVSDWFGTYSVSAAIRAGLDLEMPGPPRFRGAALSHAISSGKVDESTLDQRVRAMLHLINEAARSGIPTGGSEVHHDRPADQELLRTAAADSIVLLKNDDGILPLRRDRSVAVIGPNANYARYCGGGSASLEASYTVSPLDGIRAQASDVRFSQGSYSHQQLPLLGEQLKTPDGKTGFSFRVYYDPPEATHRELAEELLLTQSEGFLMDYADSRFRTCDFYIDMEGYFTPEEDGIYDFGVSVCGTGRLFIDGALIVDNATKQTGGTSFFGSGTREERGSMSMVAGRRYRLDFLFGSSFTSNFERRGAVAFGPGGFRFGGCKRLDPHKAIDDAISVAQAADQVVVVVGLNGEWECEGYDRDSMEMPPYSDLLVKSILQVRKDAVIIVQSGTPVTLPWVSQASALLQAWYGGNEVGNGIADVLFGSVNPSGKLPLSYPINIWDTPAYLNFGSESGRVLYGEDVYVGYRYYEKTRTPVLFPFGYGLSYTTFNQTNLVVSTTQETITVSLTIQNTGSRAGAEVVCIYIVPTAGTEIKRPMRELRGVGKRFLEPGASTNVVIEMPLLSATSYWHESRNAWLSEKGEYKVLVVTGTNSAEQNATFLVDETKQWRGL
ncbi:hypothetical protein ASPBRDRAFT_666692 [Aspergillus brasiliensis CBS 101740]|uniref:beta-glucosidase n=1 Tax=Aspergillus brasiliensis (strain CBS 101740 / IMI 381727 / IBT 21946) TaxID=767769 RepID=A0A1L9U2Y4_ASPBC|nr:hypothetical protein ASPBRDRAFT_666692 [Aspergillus brasiliensis CBS 101740]